MKPVKPVGEPIVRVVDGESETKPIKSFTPDMRLFTDDVSLQ